MNEIEKMKEVFIDLTDKFMIAYARQSEFSECQLSKEEVLALLEDVMYDWLIKKGMSVLRAIVLSKSVAKAFEDEPKQYIMALVDEVRREIK